MNKCDLLEILNAGVAEERISPEEKEEAGFLYEQIYELHLFDESGDEHAHLAVLINQAVGVDVSGMKERLKRSYSQGELQN